MKILVGEEVGFHHSTQYSKEQKNDANHSLSLSACDMRRHRSSVTLNLSHAQDLTVCHCRTHMRLCKSIDSLHLTHILSGLRTSRPFATRNIIVKLKLDRTSCKQTLTSQSKRSRKMMDAKGMMRPCELSRHLSCNKSSTYHVRQSASADQHGESQAVEMR